MDYASDVIMSVCDVNNDGKIDGKEMSMVIIQSGKMENLYEDEPSDDEADTYYVWMVLLQYALTAADRVMIVCP